MRRAAVSISNNIAEGSGGTTKEFASFLTIAIRSTMETVSILFLAHQRNYVTKEERCRLYQEAEVLVKRTRAFKKSITEVKY